MPADDLQNTNLDRNHYTNPPYTEERNSLFIELKCNEEDCNFVS
jgi:hypothetical protein